MSRKTRDLETRIVELEKQLGNINRNMEYISNKIHTAVQIEMDEVWNKSMERYLNDLENYNHVWDE